MCTYGCEAYESNVRVNDFVIAELDRQTDVRALYRVWLPPAFAALLALQKPDFRSSLVQVMSYGDDEGELHIPQALFVRPDNSFCWRVAVGITRHVLRVHMECISYFSSSK
jgi:hypothetical protein